MRVLTQQLISCPSKARGKLRLTRRLSRDALEDVVDERVQDGHRLVGDTSIRVDLLEDYTLRENLNPSAKSEKPNSPL